MRVIVDECVDRRLARDITVHELLTVPGVGWAGLKNGELLRRAEREFDAFVTIDSNLPFRHDLSEYGIAVIVLRASSNRLADLRRLVPQLLLAVAAAKNNQVTWAGHDTP